MEPNYHRKNMADRAAVVARLRQMADEWQTKLDNIAAFHAANCKDMCDCCDMAAQAQVKQFIDSRRAIADEMEAAGEPAKSPFELVSEAATRPAPTE